MSERFARCRPDPGHRRPALAGALVNLDGRIVATHAVGTHSVFIVELQQIQVPEGATALPGLAYFNRGYHTLGHAAA
jgi:flavin reductase